MQRLSCIANDAKLCFVSASKVCAASLRIYQIVWKFQKMHFKSWLAGCSACGTECSDTSVKVVFNLQVSVVSCAW